MQLIHSRLMMVSYVPIYAVGGQCLLYCSVYIVTSIVKEHREAVKQLQQELEQKQKMFRVSNMRISDLEHEKEKMQNKRENNILYIYIYIYIYIIFSTQCK